MVVGEAISRDVCRLLASELGETKGAPRLAPGTDLLNAKFEFGRVRLPAQAATVAFSRERRRPQVAARVFRARSGSRPDELSPGSRGRTVGAIVVALILAGAIGTLYYFAPWEKDQPPQQTPADSDVDFETYESGRGGYAFDYPSDWTLSEEDTFTQISSPGKEIIVSFGVAPAGDLLFSTESLIDLLRDTYSPLEVEASELGSTSGYVSMTRSGTGTSESGEKFDFEAMVLETKARNYALLSFESAEQASEENRSLADRIIASFRLE